ncbi:MAG: ABC transporter permease [Theionarchaea archaeon]|nr:ABC transporter permease [Theionarchaea archaeon]
MSMWKFITRRIIQIVITLFIIASLIFFVFRLTPGSPEAGGGADRVYYSVLSPRMTPELKALLRQRFGLDKPLWEQYLIYIRNVFRGEFGVSFYWEMDVWDMLRARLLPTILLFSLGNTLAFSIGINLGRVIAWRRGQKIDYGSTVVGLFFYTMPIFWLGLLAIWLLGFKLDLFPLGGMKTPEIWTAANVSPLTKVLDMMHHLFLPLTVLTIWIFVGHMLLMKNSMLGTLKEDYITTARAKGLPEKKIRDRHAARNAMLPVVTAFALNMAFSINGNVLTETVFSWPGIGSTLVDAVMNSDYPLAQGAFIIMGGILLVAVLFADILYVYLDPRIKYE